MNEDLVEMIEIWQTTDKGGEAYDYKKKRNLKLVALIVNGVPIRLEKEFSMERRYLTREESENIINRSQTT